MHAQALDLDSNLSADERAAELAARAMRLAPLEGVNSTCISSAAVMRASSPSQPCPSLYDPCLCIVVQGRKHAMLGSEIYVYDALNYLVVSVTLPMIGQIMQATPDRPYLCLRLNIDLSLIAELLTQIRPAEVSETHSDRGLFVAQTSEPMLDAVLRLVRLLDEPQDAAILAPLVLREIHYRALTGELGHRLRELCSSGTQAQRIGRVISMIKTRFSESLRIDELAEAVHMSSSSLHHHFKAVTSMSPLQFQKYLQLHEARRLMLMHGMDAAAAGHRVGYESASQFSREYRRLFGAPPRREVEMIRI